METKDKTKGEEEQAQTKARLTVTCKNLKAIEKCIIKFHSKFI